MDRGILTKRNSSSGKHYGTACENSETAAHFPVQPSLAALSLTSSANTNAHAVSSVLSGYDKVNAVN